MWHVQRRKGAKIQLYDRLRVWLKKLLGKGMRGEGVFLSKKRHYFALVTKQSTSESNRFQQNSL